MKIRIVQTGYETFTGLLGDVKFEDGVSVADVTKQQMDYVGSMFVVAPEDEPVEGVVDPIVTAPAAPEQVEDLTPEGQNTAEEGAEAAHLTPEGQNAEGAE